MKSLSNLIAAVGIIVIAYAIFSRFYGQPCVALLHFKSSNMLVLGNSLLLIALLAKK